MKTVKILFFSVVFTLTFCFAAFASEKKIPATENFTNDVVYDNPRNLENADANNLAAFTYTSVTGNVVSLEAGGYVYLNSSSSDAQ
jgi:hypothetical protein